MGTYSPDLAYAGMGVELIMFDKVSQAYADIYNGITDEYIGRSEFKITPEIESAFLDYVNNRKIKDPIVFQNVSLFPGPDDYVIPLPYEKHSRKGTFRVMFRDRHSLQWVLAEIHARFNARARVRQEDLSYIGSVEYTDIIVEGMDILADQITCLDK